MCYRRNYPPRHPPPPPPPHTHLYKHFTGPNPRDGRGAPENLILVSSLKIPKSEFRATTKIPRCHRFICIFCLYTKSWRPKSPSPYRHVTTPRFRNDAKGPVINSRVGGGGYKTVEVGHRRYQPRGENEVGYQLEGRSRPEGRLERPQPLSSIGESPGG